MTRLDSGFRRNDGGREAERPRGPLRPEGSEGVWGRSPHGRGRGAQPRNRLARGSRSSLPLGRPASALTPAPMGFDQQPGVSGRLVPDPPASEHFLARGEGPDRPRCFGPAAAGVWGPPMTRLDSGFRRNDGGGRRNALGVRCAPRVPRGAWGRSPARKGAWGRSPARKGAWGRSPARKGAWGRSPARKGAWGRSPARKGAWGRSPARKGAWGRSPARKGAWGRSPARKGARGAAPHGRGRGAQPRTAEGGWVGRAARSALVRDGGVGACEVSSRQIETAPPTADARALVQPRATGRGRRRLRGRSRGPSPRRARRGSRARSRPGRPRSSASRGRRRRRSRRRGRAC